MTQMLTQENNQEKNQDLEHEEWFLAFQNQWFLSKESKVFLPGKDTWFANPLQTAKIVHKAGRSKRVDISKVKIQITKDPELLQQYYDLRERTFRSDLGFKSYDGQENKYDKNGRIFIGTLNGEVVSGARLMVSSDMPYLVHEDIEKNFTYQVMCKSLDIDLCGVKYAEISALCEQEKFRVEGMLDKLLEVVIGYCRSENIKYMFGITDLTQNRNYKKTFTKINVKSIIADKINVPAKIEFNNKVGIPIIILP
jgi:hypothetical protein